MTSEDGLALARQRLERAYALAEGHLAGKTWATDADYTLAVCAASPSLFYADRTHQIPDSCPSLRT